MTGARIPSSDVATLVLKALGREMRCVSLSTGAVVDKGGRGVVAVPRFNLVSVTGMGDRVSVKLRDGRWPDREVVFDVSLDGDQEAEVGEKLAEAVEASKAFEAEKRGKV